MFRLSKRQVSNDTHPNYFTEVWPPETPTVPMHVILRQPVHRHVSRLRPSRPTEGDVFYLRAILQHKPIRSFQDALTVHDTVHESFQRAAAAIGLFADENEATYAVREAIEGLRTPRQIRLLFVHLLVNDCMPTPLSVWDAFKQDLAFDFALQQSHNEPLAENRALQDMAFALEEHGVQLSDFGLPEPLTYAREVEHELQRWNSNRTELHIRATNTVAQLNLEQRHIYDNVMSAVSDNRSLLRFIDGRAGRGKTFLVNAICDAVRALGEIVLPTASSAFAAQQYPGGRTTHSALKVTHSLLFGLQLFTACFRFLSITTVKCCNHHLSTIIPEQNCYERSKSSCGTKSPWLTKLLSTVQTKLSDAARESTDPLVVKLSSCSETSGKRALLSEVEAAYRSSMHPSKAPLSGICSELMNSSIPGETAMICPSLTSLTLLDKAPDLGYHSMPSKSFTRCKNSSTSFTHYMSFNCRWNA
jgi:hypothetical protein